MANRIARATTTAIAVVFASLMWASDDTRSAIQTGVTAVLFLVLYLGFYLHYRFTRLEKRVKQRGGGY
ncbi:MAG: hypothetical protein JWN46_1756 [Acidimicrobiales bacterium]|nr:hypothetical protein [Acidimicrobiales bacterium]